MKGLLREFTAEGLNIERLLQAAGNAGIRLHRLRRLAPRKIQAAVGEHCLPVLQELAAQGGWRLEMGKRIGGGRLLDRLRGRMVLAAAVLTMVLLCCAATQVVWQIRITGAHAYDADVRQALSAWGVHVPMLRAGIDPAALRDALEWRYPQAAWFEVGWRGMTLEVRMVTGVSSDVQEAFDGSCDVVAARDGVVHHLITRAGTPVVSSGDVVREGDVLIRGEERTSEGAMRPVAARGSVYARVWDSAAVQTRITRVETEYTGRSHRVQNVVSPWFALWATEVPPFEHADVGVRELPLGGFFWPLKIRIEEHYEADFRSVKADLQSVIDENEMAARRKLFKIIGEGESVVDIWVNWSIIEDEILLSVATGERLVDIAQQERSSGMAATE